MFGHHLVIYLDYFFIYYLFIYLVYQSNFNVLDDELNKWVKGQIYQTYRPQGFLFTIQYGGEYYTMENKVGSLVTEIRNKKKTNNILSTFRQTYFHPIFASSKYNIQINTDELPHPIYILALYALDSTKIRSKVKFIP
jgi:hypothetical protein